MYGRTIPPRVFNSRKIWTGAESVLVRMPNGDGLMSDIQELENNIAIINDVHTQPRCSILYGNGKILVAVLQRYSELP